MGLCTSAEDRAVAKAFHYERAAAQLLPTMLTPARFADGTAYVFMAELVAAVAAALSYHDEKAAAFCRSVADRHPVSREAWAVFAPFRHDLRVDRQRAAMISAWLRFDTDYSGDFSMPELRTLVHALNFPDALQAELIRMAKARRAESLSFSDFEAVYSAVLRWDELDYLWTAASEGRGDPFAVSNGGAWRGSAAATDGHEDPQPISTAPGLVPVRGRRGASKATKATKAAQAQATAALALRGVVVPEPASPHAALPADKYELKLQQLRLFLSSVQQEGDVHESAALDVIAQYGGVMHKRAFLRYLTDPEVNSAVHPRRHTVYQEMHHPMHWYFINSSHNTYLTGDQLTSKSSPDAYVKALRDGCRCVELDCWAGKDGEPIIYHGYTRTSKISFESVVEAINEHAFAVSDFPVILSLEVHTSLEQQRRMADIMKRVFGTKLAPPMWEPGEAPQGVLRPCDYLHKILVKNKRLPPPKTSRPASPLPGRSSPSGPGSGVASPGPGSGGPLSPTGPPPAPSRHASMGSMRRQNTTSSVDLRASPLHPESATGTPTPRARRRQRAGVEPMSTGAVGSPRGRRSPGDGANVNAADPSGLASSGSGRLGRGGPRSFRGTALMPQGAGKKKDDRGATVAFQDATSSDGSDNDPAEIVQERRRREALAGARAKKPKIHADLSAITWMESKHLAKSFDAVFDAAQPYEVVSLAERKAEQLAHLQTRDMAQHNKLRFARIYPAGQRIDSSNYHPQPHWNVGAQLVALNWQTSDSYPLRLNKGKFADNGNCGFVLKPAHLREWGAVSYRGPPLQVEVEFLSAFALPKPDGAASGEIVDPYVFAFLEGPGDGCGEARGHRTTVVDDNGFHPVWRSRPGSTCTLTATVPELTTLVVQVFDQDVDFDDFLAECFVPLPLLRQGVRCFPLQSLRGDPLVGSFVVAHIRTSLL